MAGYCSAVYLQQYIPITPDDSASAVTGVVSGDGDWFIKDPEMIFASGHNRDGHATTPADVVLNPGTRMNFFIGVDKDCSEEDQWVSEYHDGIYDWIHPALTTVSDIDVMEEGKFSMIEQHQSSEQRWRIAFEDLDTFTNFQLMDIKLNGYGSLWNLLGLSYGGLGWTDTDALGYKALKDIGWKPDFSDQEIEITLRPCEGECEPGPTI
jgi:hypothetical protein